MDDQPRCGVGFCEACGDCLACYGEDRCDASEDGKHVWVKHEEGAQESATTADEE